MTFDSLPAMLVLFFSHFQFTFGHNENHVARILLSQAHPLSPGFPPGAEGCCCRTLTNPLRSFPFMHLSFSLIFSPAERGSWGNLKSPMSSKISGGCPQHKESEICMRSRNGFCFCPLHPAAAQSFSRYLKRSERAPCGASFSCSLRHSHLLLPGTSLWSTPHAHASFQSSEAGSPHRVV